MISATSDRNACRETMGFAPFNPVPFYTPVIWQGMPVGDWLRMLAEYRFRVDGHRIPRLVTTFITPVFIPAVKRLQHALYGRQATSTPLVADPIFVIGHWRSGTTLLHELLTLDQDRCSPTTYQVFCPFVSLVSERWLKRLIWFMIPPRRPMDNMDFGWDTPQEDEFAIVSMGLPTTYRRMAFPNEEPRHLEYLNMEGVPRADLEHWQKTFHLYVQYLNLNYGKQLALKSPPHTGRIRVLLDMFPKAKFIHITRDPQKFIPSTMHLWGALDQHNGLQRPHHQNLREHVFACYERIYQGFYRDEHLLHPGNFASVRFEQLVRDPAGEMKRVYQQLNLGPTDQVIPEILKKMARDRDYRPNQHEVPADLRDDIHQRCSVYNDRFGYGSESVAA